MLFVTIRIDLEKLRNPLERKKISILLEIFDIADSKIYFGENFNDALQYKRNTFKYIRNFFNLKQKITFKGKIKILI